MAPMIDDLQRVEQANDFARRMAEALRPYLADMISSAIAEAILAHTQACDEARRKRQSFREAAIASIQRCPMAAAVIWAAWLLRAVLKEIAT